jgi:hypothetical protein
MGRVLVSGGRRAGGVSEDAPGPLQRLAPRPPRRIGHCCAALVGGGVLQALYLLKRRVTMGHRMAGSRTICSGGSRDRSDAAKTEHHMVLASPPRLLPCSVSLGAHKMDNSDVIGFFRNRVYAQQPQHSYLPTSSPAARVLACRESHPPCSVLCTPCSTPTLALFGYKSDTLDPIQQLKASATCST